MFTLMEFQDGFLYSFEMYGDVEITGLMIGKKSTSTGNPGTKGRGPNAGTQDRLMR